MIQSIDEYKKYFFNQVPQKNFRKYVTGAVVNDIKAIQKAKEATFGDSLASEEYRDTFRTHMMGEMKRRIPDRKITRMKIIPRNK